MSGRVLTSLVLTGICLLMLAVLAYAILNVDPATMTATKLIIFYAGPLVGVVACLLVFRLSTANRTLVILTAVATIAATYLAQAYMLWSAASGQSNRIAETAARLNVPYDNRSKMQVVLDMRAKGLDAWPAVVTSKAFSGPVKFKEGRILPLSGLARKTSVLCNEMGQYTVYNSDEYGFNNPPGVWTQPVDLMAVGDSFVHGACVPAQEGLVPQLRRSIPTTINLGIGGRGPLMELATFLEYGPVARPRLTLFFFYDGNDLVNLAGERHVPWLMSYLREEFTQRLASRQNEIDELLVQMVESAIKAGSEDYKANNATQDFLMLRPLRDKLGLNMTGVIDVPVSRAEQVALLPLLSEVMERARRAAATWGGKVGFVFLPDMDRFANPQHYRSQSVGGEVLAAVAGMDIPILDLAPAFAAHPNPRTLWYHVGSHYSVEGYQLVADQTAQFAKTLLAAR